MKYVVVTGAYGGMGRAVVKELKNKGYFVFALDLKVEEQEQNVMPIEVDVTDEKSVKNAYEKVKTVTGELYAVLHFAGIYTLNSLVEISEEKFKQVFDVNVFGVYRINKTFLPLLKSGSRVLITTSELAPLHPLPFTGLYAVTKGALDKYAYSLRMELQLLGIKVIALRPGAVKTDMLDVSTCDLDRFCENTTYYSCNAKRFKKIVGSVEARHVSPEQLARKSVRIIAKNNPKFVYSINRNPLLLTLNVLPKRMQTWIIKQVLR